jgi:hypothetical protein
MDILGTPEYILTSYVPYLAKAVASGDLGSILGKICCDASGICANSADPTAIKSEKRIEKRFLVISPVILKPGHPFFYGQIKGNS